MNGHKFCLRRYLDVYQSTSMTQVRTPQRLTQVSMEGILCHNWVGTQVHHQTQAHVRETYAHRNLTHHRTQAELIQARPHDIHQSTSAPLQLHHTWPP